MFARCIYGGQVTLTVGVVATFVGLVVGGTMGVMAGYFKGRTDEVISFVIDGPARLAGADHRDRAGVPVRRPARTQYSWLAWLDRIWQITVVLSLVAIAPLARIVRAQTLSLSRAGVRARGAEPRREGPPRHPAARSSRTSCRRWCRSRFTGLGLLIAAEGALAFLGYSVKAPTPTWGKMITKARYNRIDDAWWASLMPAVMLFLTVLSFNLIGDRVARRFDIREAAL